jgi:hypothetical protein
MVRYAGINLQKGAPIMDPVTVVALIVILAIAKHLIK